MSDEPLALTRKLYSGSFLRSDNFQGSFVKCVGFPNFKVNRLGQVKGSRDVLMKGHLRPDGYIEIKASDFDQENPKKPGEKSKRKNPLVHILVATAFIPNPNSLPVVNHKDGNRANNRVENLEWVTYSENTQHAHKSGSLKVYERSVDQYTLKCEYIRTFKSATEAAKVLGLTSSSGISKVCNKNQKQSAGFRWAFTGESPGEEKKTTTFDIEGWKQIKGYEKYYVSRDGRVYWRKETEWQEGGYCV